MARGHLHPEKDVFQVSHNNHYLWPRAARSQTGNINKMLGQPLLKGDNMLPKAGHLRQRAKEDMQGKWFPDGVEKKCNMSGFTIWLNVDLVMHHVIIALLMREVLDEYLEKCYINAMCYYGCYS